MRDTPGQTTIRQCAGRRCDAPQVTACMTLDVLAGTIRQGGGSEVVEADKRFADRSPAPTFAEYR